MGVEVTGVLMILLWGALLGGERRVDARRCGRPLRKATRRW
jgi:hypothetical protein